MSRQRAAPQASKIGRRFLVDKVGLLYQQRDRFCSPGSDFTERNLVPPVCIGSGPVLPQLPRPIWKLPLLVRYRLQPGHDHPGGTAPPSIPSLSIHILSSLTLSSTRSLIIGGMTGGRGESTLLCSIACNLS